MTGSVDVVLLTLDSERMLKKCVQSIYDNIPVHKLIVVDGYSTDKTLSIIGKFSERYQNVEILMDKGNRATARQKGIERVSTEWFMFVDSDVILCSEWYKKAQKYIQSNVGALWGIEVWSTINNPKTLKIFLIVTRKIFEVRGGTHDTLIRTELIKDIKIPNGLHVFEDAYIRDWIANKGYRVVACYSPFCIHYRPKDVWTFRGSLRLVAESVSIGHPRLVAKLLFAYGFYTVYYFYQLLAK
jgi:glycosyltransferase involved in cell wall biosynthesis